MYKNIVLAFVLMGVAGAPVLAAEAELAPLPVSETEAHSIGIDAYLYFYSLVTMELTREQLTNVERNYPPLARWASC
jgi:hypothetical protein